MIDPNRFDDAFFCPPAVRGGSRVVGVLGYPVAHSASPPMHNAAFRALGLPWVYVPFAVAPDDIGAALAGVRALGLAGVNVTVPLKELVLPYLDQASARAQAIGSVNTVVNHNGRLIGDSTDGPGFLRALHELGAGDLQNETVVVLGAGGSARAVVHSLVAEAGANVVVANRSRERADDLAARFAPLGSVRAAPLTEEALREALRGARVLVNTTSIGMQHSKSEGALPPVPPDALTPDLFVSDLVYNPAETPLLALARQRGCRIQNGVEMLVQQGAIAFQQWTGMVAPLDVMRRAVLSALAGQGE